MREYSVPQPKLAESMWIHWKRPAEDYFDMLVSDAFDVIHQPVVRQSEDEWLVVPNGDNAAALTFSFSEQGVGWP